jgi:hypothetical protein
MARNFIRRYIPYANALAIQAATAYSIIPTVLDLEAPMLIRPEKMSHEIRQGVGHAKQQGERGGHLPYKTFADGGHDK